MPTTIAVAALLASASAPSRWHTVDEYGLAVALPDRAKVCESLSGGHLHGWAIAIGGDCKNAARFISVLANWNAVFYRSPRAVALCSRREGGSFAKGSSLGLSFRGHPSATCFQEQPKGKILITVATQAWRWPDAGKSADPADRTSWVNYSAYLRTTRQSLSQDLRTFRTILEQVKISRPK
jgi:hypothetical protein